MSNTNAQLSASHLSILTCVLFTATITEGVKYCQGDRTWVLCCAVQLVLDQCCHLASAPSFLMCEVEGAAGLNAIALSGTHNSAAEEGRAVASGSSTDHQPSLEEVTELNLGFVCCSQGLRILQGPSLLALYKWLLALYLQTHNFCSRDFGLVFPLQRWKLTVEMLVPCDVCWVTKGFAKTVNLEKMEVKSQEVRLNQNKLGLKLKNKEISTTI